MLLKFLDPRFRGDDNVNEQILKCAKLIQNAKSIVALTGAGISTSCGIPDFRGPKGLYVTRQYDANRVFDINSFYDNPKPFFDFARDFIKLIDSISPSFTHHFLAQLEQQGKLKGIITQNIDLLHQKAGSINVLEFHGSFGSSTCRLCGDQYDYPSMRQLIQSQDVPYCEKDREVIKPDIVFFGEDVKRYHESIRLAESADLFLVIGTSCVVQPAASIPQYSNADIVIVNLSPVNYPSPNVVLEVNQDLDQFMQEVSKQVL